MTNERPLWLAVLEQAIIDFVHADPCKREERAQLQRDAEHWLHSNNHDVGSFLWICETLDLDASWFRRRLFAMIDASRVSNRPMFWHLPIIKKHRAMTGTRTAALGLTISP